MTEEVTPPEDSHDEMEMSYPSIWERFVRAFGPIAGGIIIDVVDLVSFGPAGIFLGFLLGFTIAWWVGGLYRMPKPYKIIMGVFAGVYCTIPMTEVFPIGTLFGAIARFFDFGGNVQMQDGGEKGEGINHEKHEKHESDLGEK